MSGNIFENTSPVEITDMPSVMASLKSVLPSMLWDGLIKHVGSAGYRTSNDVDLMVDTSLVIQAFSDAAPIDDSTRARRALMNYIRSVGIPSRITGRTVHACIPYNDKFAQVDLMVITDANRVAPFHQHGLRGMYSDPDFSGAYLYRLLASVARFHNLKIDVFAGEVKRRHDNICVANTREMAAFVLFGTADASIIDSVKTVLDFLKDDPQKELKLQQAFVDVEQGLLKL